MSRPRPVTLWLLLVLLVAEFVLVAGLVVTLIVEILVAPAASLGSAVALTALAALAAVWLAAIIAGASRGRAWARSAAIVWQVLQFAVGIGALQGVFAQPAWGWPLVGVAVVAFLLLISKPVAEALTERNRR